MPLSTIGSVVVAPQPLEAVPGQVRVREDAEEVPDRGAHVLVGRLLESRLEHGVGEVLGDPDPLEEGQVGLLEVARLPAGDVVVDREDEGASSRPPRRGGPCWRRSRRRSASRAGTSGGRRRSPRRSPPSAVAEAVLVISGSPSAAAARADASSPVGVEERLHADRRQQHRRRASRCRAARARGRARRGRAAPAGRSASAGRPPGWRASCPRSRRRRRCRRPRGRRAPPAPARSSSAQAIGRVGFSPASMPFA